MTLRLNATADERAGDRMLDIASAIDAGLPAGSFGGEPGDGDDMVARALGRGGIQLAVAETVALRAAWKVGRAPASLRQLSARRHQRASFIRQLRSQLLYPLTLAVVAFLVSLIAARLGSPRLPWIIGGTIVAVALLGFFVIRAARAGHQRVLALPVLGPLVADLGELSYLETLHACYASGVPLLTANQQAVAACPVLAIRQHLFLADQLAQQGRGIAESLTQLRAVHAETLTVLAVGEKTGTLEDALQRAIGRRRDVAQRRATALAKGVGVAIYVLGVAVAAATILSFWSGYAAALRSIR